MEAKIKEYIKRQNKSIMDRCLEVINCKHRWRKFGLRYICEECWLYTNEGDKLNKLIKQLLAKKK